MADAKLQALFYCDQQLLSQMVQPPSVNQTNLVVLMHDDRRVLDPEEHGALRCRVLHLVLELARVVGPVLFGMICHCFSVHFGTLPITYANLMSL